MQITVIYFAPAGIGKLPLALKTVTWPVPDELPDRVSSASWTVAGTGDQFPGVVGVYPSPKASERRVSVADPPRVTFAFNGIETASAETASVPVLDWFAVRELSWDPRIVAG